MRNVIFLMCLGTFCFSSETRISNWIKNEILTSTGRKEARTAVLIIAPTCDGNCYVHCRWMLGRKAWEQYMNSHPNVDCYFLKCVLPKKDRPESEQVWIEDNTICVGDWWYEKHGNDRLLYKTVAAIEFLQPKYTHFIRTNINTFLNLQMVNEFMETHHQSFYTTPLWESAWYTIGYGIVFSADVAAHIASEFRRLENQEVVSPYQSDDACLTALATGVYPYEGHIFRPSPGLPAGVRQLMCESSLANKRLSKYGVLLYPAVSFEQSVNFFEQAGGSTMLYRIRNGYDLCEFAELYEYLLRKNYPGLQFQSLVDFSKTLPTIKEN